MSQRDYYRILGVPVNANEQEIKRAYRELARRYHPDLNPDDENAENRFKEINEAYTVLSDTEKRAHYDRTGSTDRFRKRTPNEWQRTERSRASRTNTRQSTPNTARSVFSEFINSLFRESPARTETDKTPIRGFDIEVPVTISLEESYTGTVVKVAKDESGNLFTAQIPPGARTGTKVRFAGQGKRGFAGGERGDLYVVVAIADHPTFEREGDNLHVELKIDLYTAVLGGEHPIPTMTGEVLLRIPPGTQSGKRIRLLGKGMPRLKNSSEYGDLFVKPLIQVPENLSDTELELFEHLRSLRPDAGDR